MLHEEAVVIINRLQTTQVPREVRFKYFNFYSYYYIFLILVVAVSFLAGSKVNFFKAAAYYFGKQAEAVVTYTQNYKTESGRNGYGVYFSFPKPDNDYDGFIEVGKSFYENTRKGDIIRIHYLEAASAYPFLDDYDKKAISYFYIPSLILAVFILLYVWSLIQSHNLMKYGTAVEGTAEGYDVIITKSGKAYIWKIKYQWNNREYVKKFRSGIENPIRLVLLIDPNNPNRARFYDEKLEWKLAGTEKKGPAMNTLRK